MLSMMVCLRTCTSHGFLAYHLVLMINNMTTLLYKPLPGADSIRLVQIASVKHASMICLSLVDARLSDSPVYEALSYTWGNPGDEQPVLVNGHQISIRGNLHAALAGIREAKGQMLLWVDALCISQTDLKEKSQQVGMIGRIFREAQQTLVWLGPATDEIPLLFSKAQQFPPDSYIYHEPLPKATDLFSRSELSLLQTAMEHCHSVRYWSRAWIVQECILPRRLTVFCGPHNMTWHQFFTIHRLLRHEAGLTPLSYSGGDMARIYPIAFSGGYVDREITMFDQLAGQREHLQGKRRTLGETLRHFSWNRDSLDPRDLIFAFMELLLESQDGHPAQLRVDYSMPMPELYFKAMHAFLSNDDALVLHGGSSNVFGVANALKLKPDEIRDAVEARVDPGQLLSPMGYITSGDEGGGVKSHPNPEESERGYTFIETMAADFELLATGKRGPQAQRRFRR